MINLDGWVKLHRSIMDHWVWKEKPYSKGQAWLDILMECNHKPGKVNIGASVIPVERGQKLWSIKDMSERWGWSRKKVSGFLNVLETDGMLHQKRTSKYTLLTIINYDFYQSKDDEEEHQKNITGTSKEHHGNTNKNVKNVKNVKNDKNIKTYSDNPELNASILQFIEFRKKIKSPMTDRAIELLISNLRKLSTDIPTQIAIINQSILNGWKGVFPLKEPEQPKQNKFNSHPQRSYTNTDYAELEKKLLRRSNNG